jgi:hypothetical protein
MAKVRQGYHQNLVTLSDEDTEYMRAEAGRLYGGTMGAMSKMWARVIEVYKQHSGEVKPE